jgi:AraC-like DNA-binding protein
MRLLVRDDERSATRFAAGPLGTRARMPAGPRRVIGTWGSPNLETPSRALVNIVEGIIDWDFPDSDAARSLTVKVLPSTTPYIIVQYRTPICSVRRFGDVDYQHPPYLHVATRVQNGVAVVRPTGPVGVIVVRLRPEAAPRLLGECMQGLADVKVGLGDVFKAAKVSLLAEMLSEAPSSRERMACMRRFLLESLCEPEPDRVACHAAARLRRNPALRIRRLAADLGVSERHLSRRFQMLYGMSPKQFARAARVERIALMRNSGAAWADTAYACGFADQAHMINDVNAIIGASPEQAFWPDGLFAW